MSRDSNHRHNRTGLVHNSDVSREQSLRILITRSESEGPPETAVMIRESFVYSFSVSETPNLILPNSELREFHRPTATTSCQTFGEDDIAVVAVAEIRTYHSAVENVREISHLCDTNPYDRFPARAFQDVQNYISIGSSQSSF